MPSSVVYLDARFLGPEEHATVSLFDRGYLLGDSVFASLRTDGGLPFALSMHVARFSEAAAEWGIVTPDARAIEGIVHEACARFGTGPGYVRITASAGEGGPGLVRPELLAPRFSVVVRALPSAPFPANAAVSVATLRHPPPACVDPRWKLGSYAPRIAMRREAEARATKEALVLAIDGELVSGIASNVFLVHRETVSTPRLASGCRPGVTREVCIALLRALGSEVTEARLDLDAARAADAIFFTSALLPILEASRLDDRALPGATIVERLREAYRAAARATP